MKYKFNKIHYEIEDNILRLKEPFFNNFKLKKVGGSSISTWMKTNPFSNINDELIRLIGLNLPFDNKHTIIGNKLEPLVIKFLSQTWNKKIETYNPAEINYNYFNGVDEEFGGIPDGIVELNNDKLLIEIKTTKIENLKKWEKNGVPKYYINQIELYLYLLSKKDKKTYNKAIVATLFVDKSKVNLRDESTLRFQKENLRIWKFKFTKEEIEAFAKEVEKIRTFLIKLKLNIKKLKININKTNEYNFLRLLSYLKTENKMEVINWQNNA